uniref:Uncharacterized protein n=1 Tax=Arundo donax TaxID=35708 RepID=A0A0A8YAG1_ARUDO
MNSFGISVRNICWSVLMYLMPSGTSFRFLKPASSKRCRLVIVPSSISIRFRCSMSANRRDLSLGSHPAQKVSCSPPYAPKSHRSTRFNM